MQKLGSIEGVHGYSLRIEATKTLASWLFLATTMVIHRDKNIVEVVEAGTY